MTKLTEIISINEKREIKNFTEIDTMTEVANLTVMQLHKMSLYILRTEYENKPLPELYKAAEALKILQRRSHFSQKPLFK